MRHGAEFGSSTMRRSTPLRRSSSSVASCSSANWVVWRPVIRKSMRYQSRFLSRHESASEPRKRQSVSCAAILGRPHRVFYRDAGPNSSIGNTWRRVERLALPLHALLASNLTFAGEIEPSVANLDRTVSLVMADDQAIR